MLKAACSEPVTTAEVVLSPVWLRNWIRIGLVDEAFEPLTPTRLTVSWSPVIEASKLALIGALKPCAELPIAEAPRLRPVVESAAPVAGA